MASIENVSVIPATSSLGPHLFSLNSFSENTSTFIN